MISRYDLPPLVLIERDPPLVMNDGCRVIGTLVEIEITRDRYEEMDVGYMMIPVPPTKSSHWPYDVIAGPGWRIYDSSSDHKTTWCRDLFLVVEAKS
jgi:hypothetical protein